MRVSGLEFRDLGWGLGEVTPPDFGTWGYASCTFGLLGRSLLRYRGFGS